MTAPAASVQQDREIASRAERGWDLHLTKRQLIIQTDETTYSVPGSSAGSEARSYTVHYGDGDLEECTCTDFRVSDLSCKHIVAVALIYARRRRARSRCEQCGVSSEEKTLLGGRNDRSRTGRRYCLPHHPESMAGNLSLASLPTAAL